MGETDYALRFERVIDAPRGRVWAAWTEPAKLREWYRLADACSTPDAELDLRAGGSYRLGLKPPGRPTLPSRSWSMHSARIFSTPLVCWVRLRA